MSSASWRYCHFHNCTINIDADNCIKRNYSRQCRLKQCRNQYSACLEEKKYTLYDDLCRILNWGRRDMGKFYSDNRFIKRDVFEKYCNDRDILQSARNTIIAYASFKYAKYNGDLKKPNISPLIHAHIIMTSFFGSMINI